MSAFFSGTDDANENMTQFYGVWGRVADEKPQWAFRYVVGKSKIQCDPSILIDWPKATVKETIISTKEVLFQGDTSVLDIEMPEEGLRQVSAPTEKEVEQNLIKGPFKAVAYPADWMTQHTANTFTSRYAPKSGYYGGSYGGYGERYKSEGAIYGGRQGSLEDFYEEEFEWASRAAGHSAKKWAAEEERKNANEPSLLPLAEIEQSISDEVFVAAEKGLPSAELIRVCENFAIELVQDGDDINLFV